MNIGCAGLESHPFIHLKIWDLFITKVQERRGYFAASMHKILRLDFRCLILVCANATIMTLTHGVLHMMRDVKMTTSPSKIPSRVAKPQVMVLRDNQLKINFSAWPQISNIFFRCCLNWCQCWCRNTKSSNWRCQDEFQDWTIATTFGYLCWQWHSKT